MTGRRAISLGFLLLVVTACGEGSGVTSQDDVVTDLDGITFLSAEVTDPLHDLVPGTQLRLAFDDGSVSVQAGCNQLSGRARMRGSELVVDQLGGTEMGCEKPLMDQDTWLADLLVSRPRLELSGSRLTLSKGDATVEFDEESAVREQLPLEGTRWRLESVLQGGGDSGVASSAPGGAEASLRISAGKAQVRTGCNLGAGSAEIGGSTLSVRALALTRRACSPELASLERSFLHVLVAPTGYDVDHDTLTLTSADGETGLVFKAARGS